MMMTKLTTPKSILIGFALIALSIASIPYSNLIVPKAYADDTWIISEILQCINDSMIILYEDMSGGEIKLYCSYYL